MCLDGCQVGRELRGVERDGMLHEWLRLTEANSFSRATPYRGLQAGLSLREPLLPLRLPLLPLALACIAQRVVDQALWVGGGILQPCWNLQDQLPCDVHVRSSQCDSLGKRPQLQRTAGLMALRASLLSRVFGFFAPEFLPAFPS